jgi:hypothetical protein
MARKRLSVILLFSLLVVPSICVFPASADDNDDLSSYLYGKWHEESQTPMGIMVQETVFNHDRTFTSSPLRIAVLGCTRSRYKAPINAAEISVQFATSGHQRQHSRQSVDQGRHPINLNYIEHCRPTH